MKPNPLFDLWHDVWTDLGIPGLRWQILALFLCFALGWGIARLVRRTLSKRQVGKGVVRLGVESFIRVLWPLLTLALIAAAKPVLAHYDRVDLLRVAMPLVASFALIRVAFYVVQRIFARRGPAGNVIVLFEKAFALLVWVVVSLHITGMLPDLLDALDQTFVHLGRNKVSVMAILQAVLWVGVTLILALWAAATLEERLMRLDSMHSSLRVVLARSGRAALILVAVLVSLSLVGIDLTVLSVFTGALGVGLGLGLQKLASSYVSGFVILLERGLSVGDIITVDKFTGRIVRINARHSTLRSSDGVDIVVPNDMLVSAPVQNFAAVDKSLQFTLQITVAYQTDIEHALQVLCDAALDVEHIDHTLSRAPRALVAQFTPEGIALELTCWLDDAANGKALVSSNVYRAVWRAFQQHQIKVSSAQ